MRIQRNRAVFGLTMTAAGAAALAVLAPWALPLGPVPVSLCTLMIYLAAWVLPGGRGVAAVAVYVLMGVAGVPVFSGFSGGLGQLLGPTGGYILGYLPLAALCALFVRRSRLRRMHLLGMVLGTAVLYGLGTAWFCLQTGTAPVAALAVCVLPFLPGDAVKIAAAMFLGPALRRRLEHTGLLNG